jgi:CPA2 family monovalent cation:H+ antiporter-2
MDNFSLITDLATVTVLAGIAAIIFQILGLPLMLGYLVCGLFVGPQFHAVFPIYNDKAIHELSQLGVIFLMFYIGLEFDLSRLKHLLPSALLANVLQCVSMVFLGFLTAPMLGWSGLNGLFLGGVFAISSTMITLPILKHQNGFKKDYGQAAVAILVLEDIIAIVMLVVLSGAALSGTVVWGQFWKISFLVGVFVVVVFFVGRLLSPHVLKMIEKADNPEVLSIVVVGLILGIGQLAAQFRFSVELGAFVAGAIVSQTKLSEAIEHAIESMRNWFTAIFFVTIGMLIEPKLLLHYSKTIVLLTALVVLVKVLTCWLGLFLTGVRSQTAFKAAVPKAQIGEFSFVIAGLGHALGVVDPGLTPVAIGVSLGSILVVTLLSNRADRVFGWLYARTPRGLVELSYLYHALLRSVQEEMGRSALLNLIRRPALQVLIYFFLFHGTILAASFAAKKTTSFAFLAPYANIAHMAVWLLAGLVCVPFLFAIIRNLNACLMLLSDASLAKKDIRIFTRSSVRNVFHSAILVAAVLFFSGSYLSAVASYLPTGFALVLFISLILILGFFFWRQVIRISSHMEYMFIESFSQRVQTLEEEKKRAALEQITSRYPWPIQVQEVTVLPQTLMCGKSLYQTDIRSATGACVIAISRGGYTAYDVPPETLIFPSDKLILLGTTQQVEAAKTLVQQKPAYVEPSLQPRGFKIKQVLVTKDSPLQGESPLSLGLRQRFGVNVIGIQRGQQRLTNPGAEERFELGDLVVLVSSTVRLDAFLSYILGGTADVDASA